MGHKIDLETIYQQYLGNLDLFAPEDILDVDLNLIQSLGLINHLVEHTENQELLKKTFKMVENEDKIILHNDKFIIWMTPQSMSLQPATTIMIATVSKGEPNLELIFSASGIYNNSYIILKVLEKLLNEIEENETLIKTLIN